MRTIRDKKVLLTGAASGIGRALALRFAKEGAHLFIVDIDEPGMNATAADCRALGVEVLTRRCDMSQPRDVSSSVAAVLAQWGGVDILVNNAGITYYGKTDRMSDEHWDRVIQIDLLSHLQFTRELLPSLLARHEAHIVNVSSVFGLIGVPKLSAYCTAKFGMVGFTESLRREYGREGLGVTAICPGFVRTNLFTNAPLEKKVENHKIPPRAVTTTPERVANATIRAIYRNKAVVVLEPFARFMYLMKRFTPWLGDAIFHVGRRKHTARRIAALEKKAA
jgi:NAD(P)-dependent dehydrogenase (short-subunit alcohol dehydrogenase family)